MRINVYSQELTREVSLVGKKTDNGRTYYGVRMHLASPEVLHHTPEDDDRSAITFWIPQARRFTPRDLADVFDRAAKMIRDNLKEVLDPETARADEPVYMGEVLTPTPRERHK